MTKESFEEMDASFRKDLKNARQKKVPAEILQGFSASVEARIREKESAKVFETAPRRFRAPVWIPVFAVLVLASLVVLRGGPATIGGLPAASVDVSGEIAVLRELGVWTDEDEASVGITEAATEELNFPA